MLFQLIFYPFTKLSHIPSPHETIGPAESKYSLTQGINDINQWYIFRQSLIWSRVPSNHIEGEVSLNGLHI
jgi:hypothetical protein